MTTSLNEVGELAVSLGASGLDGVGLNIAEDNPWAYSSARRSSTPTAAVHAPGSIADRGTDDASNLLKRPFRDFDDSVAMRLWDGTTLTLGSVSCGVTEPAFTLVCRNRGVVRSMVLSRGRLRLAAAYS